MSVDVKTELGTLRAVRRGDVQAWLLWCATCEQWEPLSAEQFEGRLSVNHAATGCPSNYHETHNFAREVQIQVAVRRLAPYGDSPITVHASERPPEIEDVGDGSCVASSRIDAW